MDEDEWLDYEVLVQLLLDTGLDPSRREYAARMEEALAGVKQMLRDERDLCGAIVYEPYIREHIDGQLALSYLFACRDEGCDEAEDFAKSATVGLLARFKSKGYKVLQEVYSGEEEGHAANRLREDKFWPPVEEKKRPGKRKNTER